MKARQHSIRPIAFKVGSAHRAASRRFHYLFFAVLLTFSNAFSTAEEPPAESPVPVAEVAPATVSTQTLTLADAQQRALADNPTLHAVEARIAQAEARVRQARSLYFPQVDASYTASRTQVPESTLDDARAGIRRSTRQAVVGSAISGIFDPVASPAGTVFGIGSSLFGGIQADRALEDSVSNYNGSLTARYLLFDGFSRRFSLAITRIAVDETEAGLREAQRQLLAGVAQAFYGVQLAREQEAIAIADEAFNAKQLTDAEARQRVGTGSLSDVLNFEVRVRAARTALLDARRDVEQARILLATLMGIEDAKLADGAEIAPLDAEAAEELAAPAVESSLAYALENRPDIQQNQFAVARTGAGVRQRRAAYFPTVGAFASQDVNRTTGPGFGLDDTSSSVGLSLNYSLFSGGRRKAEVAEARAIETEAEYLLEDAELNAVSEVRRTLADLTTAQEQLLLQRTTAEFVQRQRDLVEKEYNAGQGSLERLNQAQRDLIEAQGRLAQARVALRQAWHELRTATAETLAPLP